MIVYEVRCVLSAARASEFEDWIGPHMAEVVACDGFVGARAVRVEDPPDEGRVLYVCAYRVRDEAALDAYLAGPAARLRAHGVARFGEDLTASRTIGPVVAEVGG